jgi:hypothetical protein
MARTKSERTVQMSAGDLSRAFENRPIKHEPFGEDRMAKIREVRRIFEEVRPISLTHWELEFRRDTNPDDEIAIWLKMGEVFARVTEGVTSRSARQEMFDIILASSLHYRQGVERNYPEVLTHAEFRALAEVLWPDGGEESVVFKQLVVHQPVKTVVIPHPGCNPVPISMEGAERLEKISDILEGSGTPDLITIGYALLVQSFFNSVRGLEGGFSSDAVQEAYKLSDTVLNDCSPAVRAALVIDMLQDFVHGAQEAGQRATGTVN